MIYIYIIYLVGGLEHFLCFHILGIIAPTDAYFSEGLKPPTRYRDTTTPPITYAILQLLLRKN